MLAPRASFDRALRNLQDDVLVMGSLVDSAIDASIRALVQLDQHGAHQVIAGDDLIDRQQARIEERAIDLIATQQPAAGDLRTIITVLNIIAELERIGDYAEGIAKIVLMHQDQPHVKPLLDLPRMASKSRDMLRRSLSALVERDAEAARQIAAEDDEIDALYDQVFRELLTYMLNDPRTIDRATWLLWVAHNLERIGDRVTNICERVVYDVNGKVEHLNTPHPR